MNDGGDGLRLASCVGVPEEARTCARMGFGEALCGTAALAPPARRRGPRPASPTTRRPRAYQAGSALRAYAWLPLLSGNLLLGTLAFASRSRDEFAPDEREFLETICHYVAVAYERLRLVDEAAGGRPPQGRVPGDAGPRTPQPAGPDPQRPADPAADADGEAETVEQARDMMERQVGQMVRLVDDLLDVTRISRGKIELRKERVRTGGGRAAAPSRRAARSSSSMGHELDRHAAAAAGHRGRRPDPAGPGVREPAEQRRQVHRPGRAHLADRRAAGERRGGVGAGHRHRHRRRQAAAHLRDVLAGGPVAGAVAGRAGHRPDAGEAAGRDARRQHRGPAATGRARAASSSSACRSWSRRPSRRQRAERRRASGPEVVAAASWSWTTTGTAPTAWR